MRVFLAILATISFFNVELARAEKLKSCAELGSLYAPGQIKSGSYNPYLSRMTDSVENVLGYPVDRELIIREVETWVDVMGKESVGAKVLIANLKEMTPEMLGALTHLLSQKNGWKKIYAIYTNISALHAKGYARGLEAARPESLDFRWVYDAPISKILEAAYDTGFKVEHLSLSTYSTFQMKPLIEGMHLLHDMYMDPKIQRIRLDLEDGSHVTYERKINTGYFIRTL